MRSQLGAGIWDDPSAYSNDLRPNARNLTFYGSRGGRFTANGTTAVAVSNNQITANSIIICSPQSIGGTPSAQPYMSAKTVGSGFSMKAGAGDSSVYNYIIVELDLV